MIADPRDFYDKRMPEKYGSSYERGRWERGAPERAQYTMMEQVMREIVLPFMGAVNRVLEIGPGPGTWTRFLKERNPNASYILVDISSVMLSQARINLKGDFTFEESDWISFVPKQPIGFFFSSRAIEYVEDKTAAVKVVARALVSGGRGVIITKTPKPFFDMLRDRASPLHQGQIAAPALTRLLKSANLRIISIHPATGTFPGFSHPALNRFVFAFIIRLPFVFPLTLFSESYAVLFEKP